MLRGALSASHSGQILNRRARLQAMTSGPTSSVPTSDPAAAGVPQPGGVQLRAFASNARVAPGGLATAYSDLCIQWPEASKLPIVYHPSYNISFGGIEKLHPFDACKFSKVVAGLGKAGHVRRDQLVEPREPSLEVLGDVHTADYLHRIHHHNLTIVQVTELAALTMLPNKLLQWRVVHPMKLHAGGTMLAAGLALERGWAINLGGGMHHASSDAGMGWCPFDDILLAVRRARAASGGAVRRVLVVDLDAHQGNGVERDKLKYGDSDLFILDMYNGGIFPLDEDAKAAIDIKVELRRGEGDSTYLPKLKGALIMASQLLLRHGGVDLVVYNAGTDVLAGDPLGRLGLSRQGIVARDEAVWSWARDEARAPIVMLLSGGYAKDNAAVIMESLANLFDKFGLGAGAGTRDGAGAGEAEGGEGPALASGGKL